jgi:uncharacterized protein (TIGR00369 family)
MPDRRKLLNPFAQSDSNFHCFGCSPTNESGLQLQFFEDGDFLTATWEPKSFLQGYKNVLHGGIQATLLDEISTWTVFVKAKAGGVTSHMDIKYRKTVYTNEGSLFLKARIKERTTRVITVEAFLYNPQNQLCCEALVDIFLFPEKAVSEKYLYPGYDRFFESKENI